MTQPAATPLNRGQRFLVACAPFVVRLLAKTWRFRTMHTEGWQTLRCARRPYIFTLWHGHMLPLLAHHRHEGITILISEHRDGELIAQVAQRLGYQTIRGSTTRGGTRALLAIVRALEQGGEIAVTPDGPRGPAQAFAPGALIAAQRAQAPIVCVVIHVSRAWHLGSWDAFTIPKPFAKITVAYSDPTSVDADDARAAAEQTAQFQQLMQETEARALGRHV